MKKTPTSYDYLKGLLGKSYNETGFFDGNGSIHFDLIKGPYRSFEKFTPLTLRLESGMQFPKLKQFSNVKFDDADRTFVAI